MTPRTMPPVFLPAAPPGGGHLVLNEAEIGCWELVCAIKRNYPRTKIIVQQPIPVTDTTELPRTQSAQHIGDSE